MSLSIEPKKGIRLQLTGYSPIRSWQGGGKFWEHDYQLTIRQGRLAEFLPRALEEGDSVRYEQVIDNQEAASASVPLTRVDEAPAAQIAALRAALAELKAKAEDPLCDHTKRQIIEAFRLPDPAKDPELYRLYGKGRHQRLLVLWGVEKEVGSALQPLQALALVPQKAAVSGGGSSKSWLWVLLALGLLAAGGWYWRSQRPGALANAGRGADTSAPLASDSTPTGSELPQATVLPPPTVSSSPREPDAGKQPGSSKPREGIPNKATPDRPAASLSTDTPAASPRGDVPPGSSAFPSSTDRPRNPSATPAVAGHLAPTLAETPAGAASSSPSDRPGVTPSQSAAPNAPSRPSPGTGPSPARAPSAIPTPKATSRPGAASPAASSSPKELAAASPSGTPPIKKSDDAQPEATNSSAPPPQASAPAPSPARGNTAANPRSLGTANPGNNPVATPSPGDAPPSASQAAIPSGAEATSLEIVSARSATTPKNGRVEVLLNALAHKADGTLSDTSKVSEWRIDNGVQYGKDGMPFIGNTLLTALTKGSHHVSISGTSPDGHPLKAEADVDVSVKVTEESSVTVRASNH